MNFGKILKGYGSFFSGLLTFAAIAGMCILVGFLAVYPLWLLATKNAELYTIISITVFSCGILFLVIRRERRLYKKNPRSFFISLSKKTTVIGGIGLCMYLVFNYYKIAALAVLAAVFIIYGFLAFALPQEKV